jgi:DNA-directed RNA polymerase subunit RPC12/RpoP
MANEIGKKYRCPECGAEFIVTRGGDGNIHCYSQPMELKK